MSSTPLCVLCRHHPVDPAWRPFCSQRCKLQDLAHWADGTYKAPGEPLSSDTDEGDESSKSDV